MPLTGIVLGAGILESGDKEADEAVMNGLKHQFGKYEVGHYLFCMECSLKAVLRDNLPF
jgi:hypothetical protein